MLPFSLIPTGYRLSRGLFTLLGGLAVVSALPAQNLREVMPEPVPQLVPMPESTKPEIEYTLLKSALGGAQPGEAVVVAELKQVILLSDDSQLDTIQPAIGETSYLENFSHLDSAPLREMVDLFIGESVSQESILRLRLSLSLLLAEQGYPFSLVYTPPQDITDGVLQIVIKESRLGSLKVNGNQYFSDASYFGRLGLEPGGQLDSKAIQVGLDRINSNPFRSAAVQVEKGPAPATTDVVLQVSERRPYRVFAGYNNTGSEVTTEDRMFVGFTLGNVWGRAHQMTLQATTDFEVKYSKALSGNYSMDLPHNHNLLLFGAYSEIESVPNGGLDQAGTSWQLGLNYTIPLQRRGDYSHSLVLGIDYKSSDNNLELNLPPFIIPISDTLTHIVQARIEYRGTLLDDWGTTGFGAQITYSPGDLGNKNDEAAFQATRFGARPDYAYLILDASRSIELAELTDALANWTWQLRSNLQLSDRNLLGSEQFSAGGVGSVRGYEQGEVIGDNAVFLSQEWQLPVIPTRFRLPGYDATGLLRFFLFQDYARTWNTDRLPGEKAFNLHSLGAGLRFQVAQNLTLDLSNGWQLRDSGSSDTGDNHRTHLSVRLNW